MTARPNRAKPRAILTAALAGLLVLASFGPTLSSAAHEIPQELDRHHVTGQGGYVAWHVDVEEPSDGGRTSLYVHFGEDRRPTVRNASHAYLGFWLVNLDHDYVELAILASLEMDGADASVRTTQPVSLDERIEVSEDEWQDAMGGRLPISAGEWLVVAFWSTDGDVDARMTVGTPLEDGKALLDLVGHTQGTSTFSFENHAFDGSRNVNVAADGGNTCSVRECGPIRGAQARWIQDGSVRQSVDHRLFGMFGGPGSDDELAWTGGGQAGEDRQYYWFHGAAPGTYRFNVDDYRSANLYREPVAAVGVDVQLPHTIS